VAEILRATVEDIYGVRRGQIESGKDMRRRESKLHPLSGAYEGTKANGIEKSAM